MYLRDGTQDFLAFGDVFIENEYGLSGNFLPDDVVIDIGAQVGCFALKALDHHVSRLVCLEPHPDNFAILGLNLAPYKDRAAIELLQAAVWRSDGVDDCPGLVSPQNPYHTCMHQVQPYKGKPVDCVSLDSLIAKLGPVRLLKIDCEGSEYPILYTSRRLAEVEEIVGEIHPGIPWPESPLPCTPGGMAEYLGSEGFSVELRTHKRSPESLALIRAKRLAGGNNGSPAQR